MGRSLSDALLRRADLVGVHVVTGERGRSKSIAPGARLRRFTSLLDRQIGLGLAAAALLVAGAVGLGELLILWISLPNVSMVFLTAVLVSAVWFGVRAAIAASLLSFFAYDFFFIQPLYQFTIAEPQEFFALGVFLAAAFFVGWLAGRARDQERRANESARATSSLFELSRKLSGAAALPEILEASTIYAQKTLGARGVVMLLPADAELALASSWPPVDELNAGELGAARWAFEKREAAGWTTGTLPNVRFQFRPLTTARGVVAVCGFEPARRDQPIAPTLDRALNLILDQTAIAIDRARLVKEATRTAALEDNEKLRTTLLASLSHDLRTPLASITGAVTTLQKFGDGLPEDKRRDLLGSIEEEAQRLTRFVANLLDMSKIEAGALKPKSELVDAPETIRAALERARKAFPQQNFAQNLARDLPFVRGDAELIEQVLFNLLDNAQKYGGGGQVTVHARAVGSEVLVTVTDEGPGIKLGRSRPGVREILSGRTIGWSQDRRRSRPVDRQRPHRGDGRPDLGGEPGGAAPRDAHSRRAADCSVGVETDGRRRRERLRMNPIRILVVDDEPQILRFLRPALEASGYEVLHAETGREALRLAANAAPDLIVLDLGLPDIDGKEVLTQARQFTQVPILILSAREREAEKISALDLGADDYIEKPFAIGELLARLRAALRHAKGAATVKMRVEVDGLVIDRDRRLVTRDGAPIKLTPREYDLLTALAINAGRVMTHSQILTAVWGPAHKDDTQYLRVFVGQLRAKIERDPSAPTIIRTESGIGYRFIESP